MQKSKFKVDELTLVLIVALIAIIVAINNKSSEPGMEAKRIADAIMDDHGISFASNGIVDENRLEEVRSMGYRDLKGSLKARNDFCVYLEDEDGSIILAKGSSKLDGEGLGCRG